MGKMARSVSLVLLILSALSLCGCIHTWTETYREYPPSAYDPARIHPHGSPDGG